MAFIVILHLSPDFDSQLGPILQTVTSLPIRQVNDRLKMEPGSVYVISPNGHLVMEDGHRAVLPNTTQEKRRALVVDIFFRTLADLHGPRAVGVVLSGTGTDGSMGLKRIKENGGARLLPPT
ncbi:chemotaxis protein CheB [Spirosoma radiotolerans]|uniref:protein-glutamate methylesterase n=1 Tax=Spirosoma radiotolerans TaxID=1379870 RepID=A0A0E3ZXK4_9BACT|nr:chemotaxis protein CheB [Spirosoma radiotolerans]AKD57148.1 hypothetical protein SD10_21885 [Spirosoma radiotolerans]